MKYLKVEDNKAYFLKVVDQSSQAWVEIDKITKDDLMNLLNLAIESDFEMEEYKEENLANKAHQIIYKNIHEKFLDIISCKTRFKDESESMFKEAIDKYSK